MTIIRSRLSRADVRPVRKPSSTSAWIDLGDGAPPRPCLILEVSTSGAKLSLAGASVDVLPDAFALLLAQSGPKRPCRVVWRSQQEIGVSFVTDAPSIAPVAPGAPKDLTELDC
jgi:hypothetical protein